MADEELYRRWQVARLTEPLHRLEIRSATKADFNRARYDLVQLALRAIDYVVTHQASMTGTVTPVELLGHLTTMARRLAPDDPDRPWAQVAKLTLSNLLNDGRPGARTYRFRLLRLLDSGETPQLSATNEAVMLYLQALDVDLADREAAAKLILRRQMESGEFERAQRSAVDARRTAEGLAASLRDRLDETRRDLRGVDWSSDVPAQLMAAHAHVTEQLALDRRILQLADRGLSRGAERERDACRAVLQEINRSQGVHTALERLIVAAIPVYLAAQAAQRFAPSSATLAIDLVDDVMLPYLGVGAQTADAAGSALAGRLGVRRRCGWSLDSVALLLLRPPVSYERPDRPWDDPGDLDEPEERGMPEDVERVAAEVFAACQDSPRRISALAQAGADRADEVQDPDLLADVLHLAAAGRFVAGGFDADEPGAAPGLPAALAGLRATADGMRFVSDRWQGDDLLVSRTAVEQDLERQVS
ncbi:hypothetical protein [Cryptosporangium sp. NPDC048952]|uniref:hypothetical protein n=1 Tax=Cryptosporangium sp. NPDC048952 TaxID=3363961 RepID=UPI0037189BFD